MIGFSSTSYTKLNNVYPQEAATLLDGLLAEGETIHSAFRNDRNWVVLTDRRLIVTTPQRMAGKRTDITFLTYSTIRAHSVEVPGRSDSTAGKLDLWFADLGWYGMMGGVGGPCTMILEFAAGVDLRGLARFVAEQIR